MEENLSYLFVDYTDNNLSIYCDNPYLRKVFEKEGFTEIIHGGITCQLEGDLAAIRSGVYYFLSETYEGGFLTQKRDNTKLLFIWVIRQFWNQTFFLEDRVDIETEFEV